MSVLISVSTVGFQYFRFCYHIETLMMENYKIPWYFNYFHTTISIFRIKLRFRSKLPIKIVQILMYNIALIFKMFKYYEQVSINDKNNFIWINKHFSLGRRYTTRL